MTEWPQILTALLARRRLQPNRPSGPCVEILEGRATNAQIAAFSVLMRARTNPEEVEDLLAVMLEHATSVTVPGPVLDVVGTGGDRATPVNVSTMSSIVFAAAGARVVKHGNRAASSKSGSADVLAALGVVVDLPSETVGPCLEELGIAFCFAPVFHPALRHAGEARREMGILTFFNILGPLANRPARRPLWWDAPSSRWPRSWPTSCADKVCGRWWSGARRPRRDQYRGSDHGLGRDRAASRDNAVHPEMFSVACSPISALRGGDATRNAELAREVFAAAAARSGMSWSPMRRRRGRRGPR